MHISFQRDVLLKPLIITAGFIDKKNVLPILANAYLKKQDNCITFIVNDMEIQASIAIDAASIIGDDFVITFPAKKMQDILKNMPDELIYINILENKITIKAGRASFNLQTMPAEHYPLVTISEEVITQFVISQRHLKDMLSKIHHAMAANDTRIFLNGIFLEVKNQQLRLIATDAHRLSYAQIDIDNDTNNTCAILPRKTIVEFLRILDIADGDTCIKIYKNQVSIDIKDKQLITKVIDGKYPDYTRVIPTTNDKICLINREEFLRSVQRVAVIGIDKLKTITLELNQHELMVSCHNENGESSCDVVTIDYPAGDNLVLNFNINYVLDVLTNNNADMMQWAFIDNQRSVLVTIPNQLTYKYVVMPLRV